MEQLMKCDKCIHQDPVNDICKKISKEQGEDVYCVEILYCVDSYELRE